MAFILRVDHEVPIVVTTFTDDQGYPVIVHDIPGWLNSDDTMVTIVVAEDGMSAVVTPVGPSGMAKIALMVDEQVIVLLDLEVTDITSEIDTSVLEESKGTGTLRALVTTGPVRMPPIP